MSGALNFGAAVRGFNRAEVTSFLSEAADGFERAIRHTDRMRQELGTLQSQLDEHREREATLRDTLLTAQRLAADVHESAKQEAQLIVREARGRAEELILASSARCEEIENDITELRHKRTEVATAIQGSISALRHALEFVKTQDSHRFENDNLRRHRPQGVDTDTGVGPAPVSTRATVAGGGSSPPA